MTTTYRIRLVHDDDYRSEGSYAYESEAETQKAVKHEQDMLMNGVFCAYGAIIEALCSKCDSWSEINSLWGIVANEGWIGNYNSIDDIRDEYLRDTIKDMLPE